MKKFFLISITLILLVIPLQSVKADYPSSYSSTVNVTNTTNTDGVITLSFYESDGTLAYSFDDSIGSYETK